MGKEEKSRGRKEKGDHREVMDGMIESEYIMHSELLSLYSPALGSRDMR